MKITVGEWKTRSGEKATVSGASEDPTVNAFHRCVGWIGRHAASWTSGGNCILGSADDLIEPWTDPVPWDWSTTPPWINWIAMDANGCWIMYINNPDCGITSWNTDGYYHRIPPSHAPKWSGHWIKSKTMRPGFQGGAK